jgi:hypothetical protein
MSISKGIQDAVTRVMQRATQAKLAPDTRAAAIQIGKWGAIPAAGGAGLGLGSAAAGAGISSAFGVDPSDPAGSVQKVSGWVIALAIGAVLLLVFAPKLKQVMK